MPTNRDTHTLLRARAWTQLSCATLRIRFVRPCARSQTSQGLRKEGLSPRKLSLALHSPKYCRVHVVPWHGLSMFAQVWISGD